MKYTSAEANKLVRRMQETEKAIIARIQKGAIFRATSNEDPEVNRPDFDFMASINELAEVQKKIRILKHAINVFNTTHVLPGFDDLTIDQALVFIPQLNANRERMKVLSEHLPRERAGDDRYYRDTIIDYEITNYSVEEAKKAYKEITEKLTAMQLALDTVNSTETMEVEVVVG